MYVRSACYPKVCATILTQTTSATLRTATNTELDAMAYSDNRCWSSFEDRLEKWCSRYNDTAVVTGAQDQDVQSEDSLFDIVGSILGSTFACPPEKMFPEVEDDRSYSHHMADLEYASVCSRQSLAHKHVVDYGCRNTWWAQHITSFHRGSYVSTIGDSIIRDKWAHNYRSITVDSLNGFIPLQRESQHLVRASRLAGRLGRAEWDTLIDNAWHVLEWDGILEITDVLRDFGGLGPWKNLEQLFRKHDSWNFVSGGHLLELLERPKPAGKFYVSMTTHQFSPVEGNGHFYQSMLADAALLHQKTHGNVIKAAVEVDLLSKCNQGQNLHFT